MINILTSLRNAFSVNFIARKTNIEKSDRLCREKLISTLELFYKKKKFREKYEVKLGN